jgi:hypothetical protein
MSAGVLISASAAGSRQWASDRALSARGMLLLQTAIWAAMFLLFVASPVLQMNDSQYSMLTAESIIHNHTPDLSGYSIKNYQADLPFNELHGKHAYQLVRTDGRLLYGFPHGTSLLSLPFVALMDVLGISPATGAGRYDLAGEMTDQKMLAALLIASLVVIFFRTSMTLLDWRWSAIIAMGGGLGTQLWSTASRAMWSHTWEVLLGGLVLALMLSAVVYGSSTRPILLATLVSWMFFVRPTGAASVLCVAVFMLVQFRRDFLRFAMTGVVWLFAFLAYSLRIFGTLVPFYYQPSRAQTDSLGLGIFGNLFSPSRGFFIFCPVALAVLFIAFRHRRHLKSQSLALVSLLAICLITLSAASFPIWWGGNCYGPRYLTDAVPWLVLLAILGIDAMPAAARTLRSPAIAAGALLLAVSIVINAHGAFSFATLDWNEKRPLPGVMLDWTRPQFLAGWIDER